MASDELELPTEDLNQYRKILEEEGGIQKLSDFLSKNVDKWRNSQINIGVCGETYVGKSTFINQLRGVNENDDEYAPVGMGDTTSEPTPYKHPGNENLVMWDLPGVGTLTFPRDESYLRRICSERYDFFIIMSDQCFSENDAWLGREIRRLGKSFFFVRSKLDEALSNAKYDGRNIEELVPRLYYHCAKTLKKARLLGSAIFVISNYYHEIGQFDDLMTAMLEKLPGLKCEAFLHTISPLTHQIIREKKAMLLKRTFARGFIPALSCVPLVGFLVNDVEMIEKELQYYLKQFGLDEDSLNRRCGYDEQVKYSVISSLKNYKKIKENCSKIKQVISQLASHAAVVGIQGRIAVFSFKVGSSVLLYYAANIYFLREQIKLMEEDAHRVIDVVIEKCKKTIPTRI